MQTHIKVLGWLHLIIDAAHLLVGVFVWMVLAGAGAVAATEPQGGAGVGALLLSIGTFVLGLFAVISVPGMIIGWGLSQRRPWARVAGIVISIIALFGPPFGTALGIYGLVVLCNRETIDVFEGRRAWTD